MTNRVVEELYCEIFNDIIPQIHNQQKGVLFQTIHILLTTNDLDPSEKSEARKLCQDLRIKEDSDLDEDYAFFGNLINRPYPPLVPGSKPNWLRKILNDTSPSDPMNKIAWIIVIACVLVGVISCIHYRERRKKAQRPRVDTRDSGLVPAYDTQVSVPKPVSTISVALCLVVPASVLIDVRNCTNSFEDNRLAISDLEKLLDNASYFICEEIENALQKEQSLNFISGEIPDSNTQEVYIRIHLKASHNMLDQQLRYALKKNLPDHGQGIIQIYGCLNKLSGLENFNRI